MHDYPQMPEDGLNHWLGVPARTAENARSCKEPKIGRIYGVLSWNSPTSTTDPFETPQWGNAIETHVEIPPRRRVATGKPAIRALGRIPVESIDTTATDLTKADALFIDSGRLYRAMWPKAGGQSDGTDVTEPFITGFFPS